MKCALPGRYGKNVTMESSAMADSYNQKDIDEEKKISEDIGLSFNQIIKDDRTIKEIYNDILKRYEINKEQKMNNDFEKLKQELLQKDKEEHSQ